MPLKTGGKNDKSTEKTTNYLLVYKLHQRGEIITTIFESFRTISDCFIDFMHVYCQNVSEMREKFWYILWAFDVNSATNRRIKHLPYTLRYTTATNTQLMYTRNKKYKQKHKNKVNKKKQLETDGGKKQRKTIRNTKKRTVKNIMSHANFSYFICH